MNRQQGFTLIEMIVVMVIVGVLGVGITSFIGRSVQGYADSAERQRLASIAWVVSEKLSRALRDALPNSVRLNGAGASATCLEYIPIRAGSNYLTIPLATAETSFEVAPFPGYQAVDVDDTRDRVAVYPSTLAGLYNLSTSSVISATLEQLSAGTTANALLVTLNSAHRFPADSPSQRVYVVQNPVMYCFSAGVLSRYSDYGYSASLPSSGLGAGVVIATGLSDASFNYAAGTLGRTGIVSFSFEVSGTGSARQAIEQEVQIRNVP